MKGRCGRCGNVKTLATTGPYQRMLCVECVDEKEREDADDPAIREKHHPGSVNPFARVDFLGPQPNDDEIEEP